MSSEKSSESTDLIFTDVWQFVEEAERRIRQSAQTPQETPLSYRIALGLETIQLKPVEFRILMFLASRPYHPFTRRRIAEAASTSRVPVGEDDVDQYITSLREQLHCFRDYVQFVPYVGYRFKA